MDEMGTEHWLLLAAAAWFGVRLLIFARNVLRAAARNGGAVDAAPRLVLNTMFLSGLVGAAAAYSAVIAIWPDMGAAVRTALALVAALAGLFAGAAYDLSLSLREWRVVAWLLARRLPALREQLRSHDEKQRVVAAQTICLMYSRAAPAVPDLVAAATKDASGEVRIWSAVALLFSDADHPEIVPTARAMLTDNVPALRTVAAAILVQKQAAQPGEVVAPLGEGLMLPDDNLAYLASHWLARLGKDAAPALGAMRAALFDREPPNESVLDALTEMGEAGTPLLIDTLKHPDARLRRYAAAALGSMGQDARDAVEPLQSLQSDDNEGVRRAAVEALTRILKSTPPGPRLPDAGG